MPWKKMEIVEPREEFSRAVARDEKSFSSLRQDFGIGRKTAYNWHVR